ncbi:S-layer family protein, partial [Rhizobacter sp. Root16D2]|uniref:beta strand repeat-containing protein n=1 Tax=Rhizobacter sp. Root16D2 TaxID=1736479 RepID=UPI001F38974F
LVLTLSNGQTITIAAGQTSGTSAAFNVRADDAYAQGSQTVTVGINAHSGGNYEALTTTSTASTTVTDNASATTVTLSSSANSVVEGGSVTYTATLDHAVTGTPLVLNLSNGQTITIPVGQSSASALAYVPRADDAYAQGTQTVTVGVASSSGGNFESLTTSSTVATSVTDDSDVTTVSLSGSSTVTEGGAATYTLTLSNPSTSAVTVTLNYTGTASNGTDYTGVATVTIPAGASSASFSVATAADGRDEPNESIVVSIGAVSGGGFETIAPHGTNNTLTTSLVDNDPTPTLSINNVTVNEAAGTATFTVTLSAASGQAVSVNYGTSNGSATAGSDYTAATGTLTFAAGSTVQTITVPITNDTLAEATETFNVTLSGATNATIAVATGVGSIIDNDQPPAIDLDSNNSTATGVGYATTFTENGSGVSIADSDIKITDVDSASLASATITLTNAKSGDVLTVGTLPVGITANVVGNVITLSGAASLASYETAIRAITFSNTSDTPDTTNRVITVVANDGTSNSATATTTISVVAVNDAPVAHSDEASVTAAATLSVTAANGVILSAATPAGTDTDPEGNALTVAFAAAGTGTPATAISAAGTTITGTYGTLTLKSDGSYSYAASNANAVATGTTVNDVFTYQVKDPSGATSNTTLTVHVAGQADTLTAGTPTTTTITNTLGLNGEYYGYNENAVNGNRRHSDDGSVGNLDRVADFNTLVNARNATMGGSNAILGTSTAAVTGTVDARFLAKTIDYGGSPAVTNSLGSNANVAAGGSTSGLTDANSSLYKFLDRTGAGGPDVASLKIETGTGAGSGGGSGPSSGLGTTTDAGIRLTGEVYMAAGSYDIRVTADDGFRLKLDGHQVAIFDDIQSPTTRVYTGVPITGGLTAMELLYWEQGGNSVLKIEIKATGSADTSYQTLGTSSFAMFSDANAPTLSDTQDIIQSGSQYVIRTGSTLDGGVGNDTLTGSDARDKLIGGDGNDSMNGGAADDTLIGGKGNDLLTGGAGHDVFQWKFADQGTTAAPARDVITDFDNANNSGDVLDLRDLLVGESHTANGVTTATNIGTNNATAITVDHGNLSNYLHFSVVGGNTVVEVSTNGGFTNGTYNAGAVNQVITISNLNLVGTFVNDNQVLDDLLKRGKLVVD